MTRISRLLTGAIVVAGLATSIPAAAQPARAIKNIVLVHGAFVDGSGWKAVSDILTRDGYRVSIVQPPETSLDDDVAATNRVLDQQDGLSVLVGHSYGGAVITGAGGNPHAAVLVYVAAFQPDLGESLGSLGNSMPPAGAPLVPTPDGFLFIDRAAFRADFAADIDAATTALMARSQVPLSIKSASAPASAPAWKVKPSYAIVATQDRSINPELERFMYKRSGSITTEIVSSHAVYISQPKAVARVIEQAATAGR